MCRYQHPENYLLKIDTINRKIGLGKKSKIESKILFLSLKHTGLKTILQPASRGA